jgi:hypothetical protein
VIHSRASQARVIVRISLAPFGESEKQQDYGIRGVKLNPARGVPPVKRPLRAAEFDGRELSRSNIHPTIVSPLIKSSVNIFLLQS